jgi:hypothetical protein
MNSMLDEILDLHSSQARPWTKAGENVSDDLPNINGFVNGGRPMMSFI